METSLSYDYWSGAVKQTTDPNSVTTTNSYDIFGRVLDVRRPLSHVVKTYSDDQRWLVTRTDRDLVGGTAQLISAQRFDTLWQLTSSQSLENGTQGTSNPPAAGTGITQKSQYSYISTGNFSAQSNPYRTAGEPTAGWTRTKRDLIGRVAEVCSFSGDLPTSGWEASTGATGCTNMTFTGAATTVTDPAQKSQTSTVDGLGRMTQMVETASPANYTTSYQYDWGDHLSNVTQTGTIAQRTFTYSSLGLLKYAANLENGTLSYSYDNAGNLTSVLKGDGVTRVQFDSYDGLNRATRKYFTGTAAPAVQYCYDGTLSTGGGTCQTPATAIPNAKGRLTAVSTSAATRQIGSYDSEGRAISNNQTVDTNSSGMSYTYNSAGMMTSMIYPSGKTVTYSPDGAGRVQLVSGAVSYASGIAYAPHGGITSLKLGNNLYESADFNSRLQTQELRLGSATGASDLWKLHYEFQSAATQQCGGATVPSSVLNNGNVTAQVLTVPLSAGSTGTARTEYCYDPLNRISTATETVTSPQTGGWGEAWGFDEAGNMWLSSVTGTMSIGQSTATDKGQYDRATNRLVKSVKTAPSNDVQYADQRGNMTFHPAYGTLTYDGEDRIVTAGSTTYTYDGDGRRVKKQTCSVVSGQTVCVSTYFAYDAGGTLIGEYGGSQSSTASGQQYYTVDHLGSTRVVSDSSAGVLNRVDYEPFGLEVPARNGELRAGVAGYNGASGVQVKYTGKERDGETGLDYFGARYFSAVQGRWTSPDWSASPQPVPYADLGDPKTLNLYGYVRNNPLAKADPDGHNPALALPAIAVGGLEAVAYTAGALGLAGVAAWAHDNAGQIRDAAKKAGEYAAQHPITCVDASSCSVQSFFQQQHDGNEEKTRIRHYTNTKGADGIKKDGVIKASDQGSVFAEPASNKPKSAQQVETTHQLKPGRGKHYVETDVPTKRVESKQNARTGVNEIKIRGDVPLDNATIVKRKN